LQAQQGIVAAGPVDPCGGWVLRNSTP